MAGTCWSGLFTALSPGFPREESRCRVAAGRGAHPVRQRGVLCSQHGSRWSPPTRRQVHQASPAACHSRPGLHLRSGILTTSSIFSSLFHLHVLESPKAQPTLRASLVSQFLLCPNSAIVLCLSSNIIADGSSVRSCYGFSNSMQALAVAASPGNLSVMQSQSAAPTVRIRAGGGPSRLCCNKPSGDVDIHQFETH